jgi:hypothetical protein
MKATEEERKPNEGNKLLVLYVQFIMSEHDTASHLTPSLRLRAGLSAKCDGHFALVMD